MIRSLLLWGMLAGLCAGVLAAGVGALTGEPAIDSAVLFEKSDDHGAGVAESEPVSREVQSTGGLILATGLYGLALGGLFALVFAVVYGRVGSIGPAQTAHWLAACGFFVVFLVPFLKYPASPPGVGESETIADRTGLYIAMIAISALAVIAAVRARRTFLSRVGANAATLGGIAIYAALVTGAALVLPAFNELPENFPAGALWNFRLAAIAVQFALWLVIGLIFAAAVSRLMPSTVPVSPRSSDR